MWQSGNGVYASPCDGDPKRAGSILLPPDPSYWHSCMNLILQGGAPTGNAFLRYYKDASGTDLVQALTVAQGVWSEQPAPSTHLCVAYGSGGIDLYVRFMGFDGPDPDLWHTPRVPTPGEADWLDGTFWFDADAMTVYGTASQSPAYNCLAWALGKTNGNIIVATDADIRKTMLAYGVIEVPEGDPRCNIAVLGMGGAGPPKHVIAVAYFPGKGASWSSKCGFASDGGSDGLLVTHPREPQTRSYGSEYMWFYNPVGSRPPD